MKTGVELIAIERQEQIDKHGYDREHDEDHYSGELVFAATYLLTGKKKYFPDWDFKYYEKFKSKIKSGNKIEVYKVAGALIAAEIDRIQNL